jgi:2,3-bisphosphoglycerate-independent phosphoglycerate mutase
MPTTAASGKINASVTSSKPTSTFNICDILDLNKKKSKKDSDDVIKKDHDRIIEFGEVVDDDKPENLNDESDEIINGLSEDETENVSKIKIKSQSSRSESSASHTESSQDSPPKEINKKTRKHSKSEENPMQHHQTASLLSDTLHQYPHLFQNHPAIRPWFSSNGKFSAIFLKNFHALIKHIKRVMMNVTQ